MVPTCPRWITADLVPTWAPCIAGPPRTRRGCKGNRTEQAAKEARPGRTGRGSRPMRWLVDGADALVAALSRSPGRSARHSAFLSRLAGAPSVLGAAAGARDDDPSGRRGRGPAGAGHRDRTRSNWIRRSPRTDSTSCSPGSCRGAAAGCAATDPARVLVAADRCDRNAGRCGSRPTRRPPVRTRDPEPGRCCSPARRRALPGPVESRRQFHGLRRRDPGAAVAGQGQGPLELIGVATVRLGAWQPS